MNDVPVEGESLEGNYAGAATRLAAYAADAFFMVTSYGFILALFVFLYDLAVRGDQIGVPADTSYAYLIGLVVWIYLYNGVCWAVWWKTPGMSLLGLRVVQRDGSDLHARTGFNRSLWWQLCFFVPFSQIGIIIGRERRALHDVIAGTTVVYDWNARNARWRLLARGRTEAAAGIESADDTDTETDTDTDPVATGAGADRDGADHGHR